MNNNSFLSSEGCIGRVSYILRLILLTVMKIIWMLEEINRSRTDRRSNHSEQNETLWMLVPGLNVLFLLYTCIIPSKRA